MNRIQLRYAPSFDEYTVCSRLQRLLIFGPISDDDLERRCTRLTERFRVYAACSPHGMWAPGLILTHDMRSFAEQYLPVAEIARALERLIVRSLRVEPVLEGSAVRTAATWPDLLGQMQPVTRHSNPGRFLRELLVDSEERRRFLWRVFLPPRYGCDFDRYPEQGLFLRHWLSQAQIPSNGVVRCLDAACGTGEGTYELARLVHESLAGRSDWLIDGVTLEPLELFSGAHGYFPHDPARQAAFRCRVTSLLEAFPAKHLFFERGDLAVGCSDAGPGYGVIVCNGLLGGPFLHEKRQLSVVVANLAARLELGGILLADDRFHGGWKKRICRDDLRGLLAGCGLRLLPAEEGIAGVKVQA